MKINNQDHRFIVVGITAAFIYFFLAWLLMSMDIRPGLSATMAFITTFLVAYFLQRNWTFASRAGHRTLLPRYLMAQLLCMAGSAGTAEIAHSMPLLSSSLIIAAITTLVSGGMSYFLSSRWVFVNRTPD